jgi:hypothetical protein
MLTSETAKLLAKAQLLDNRTVDRATVEAWHEVVGHLDYADALAALTLHRRESTEYLMPSHITKNIPRAKLARQAEANRQRAIEATTVRELITEQGEHVTPIRLQEIREGLKNVGRLDRHLHAAS